MRPVTGKDSPAVSGVVTGRTWEYDMSEKILLNHLRSMDCSTDDGNPVLLILQSR